MPSFGGCHRETLRYQSSAPMILPRHVSARGMDLYGNYAPEGTEIGVNSYVIHRDDGVSDEDSDLLRP